MRLTSQNETCGDLHFKTQILSYRERYTNSLAEIN